MNEGRIALSSSEAWMTDAFPRGGIAVSMIAAIG